MSDAENVDEVFYEIEAHLDLKGTKEVFKPKEEVDPFVLERALQRAVGRRGKDSRVLEWSIRTLDQYFH